MRFVGSVVIAIAMTVSGGCGNKKAEPAAAPATSSPQWVSFDDEEEEEEDDLMMVELMKATAECGNLKKLEPSAMMGKLKDGEVRCLDDTLKDSDRQTFKDKISRVLMADAWAKGDYHRWEAVVRRHLLEVDRSDPNLCYKFALHLSKANAEKSDETMKWVDVALENRSHWSGDLYKRRVNSLRKMKALSATKKWTWIEGRLLETPTEELRSDARLARNEAKTYAREWLEYAKQAGKDYTQALQLCISAAGTDGFCSGVLDD
jgi:hypothetical protein